MSNPDDGWTKIPNDLLDHMGDLGNAELRVLLAIIRKTAGYRKVEDVVSFSQFESLTGLGRQHIKGALDRLLAKGLIAREPAKRSSFLYRLVTLGNQLPTVTSNPTLPDPVTLGNQSLVTLGSTQKKEKETTKEMDLAIASDDAPAALPEKKKRTPKPEPQSPVEVRQAVAAVSQIDLKTGLKEDKIQVARVAGELWRNQRQPDQTAESFAADIAKCGRWGRQTQHPYKGSEQRIPPHALIRFWTPWQESIAKAKPAYLNGHANGTHTEPQLSLEEQRKRSAEAAKKYPSLKLPGGAQ
jgi:phage replication O-like protein O